MAKAQWLFENYAFQSLHILPACISFQHRATTCMLRHFRFNGATSGCEAFDGELATPADIEIIGKGEIVTVARCTSSKSNGFAI